VRRLLRAVSDWVGPFFLLIDDGPAGLKAKGPGAASTLLLHMADPTADEVVITCLMELDGIPKRWNN